MKAESGVEGSYPLINLLGPRQDDEVAAHDPMLLRKPDRNLAKQSKRDSHNPAEAGRAGSNNPPNLQGIE